MRGIEEKSKVLGLSYFLRLGVFRRKNWGEDSKSSVQHG